MIIQKVFRAGNSQVVAIPKDLAREVGFSVGKKVVMEKTSDNSGIVIKKVRNGVARKTKALKNIEFQSWLEMILEEDKELIQEFAKR